MPFCLSSLSFSLFVVRVESWRIRTTVAMIHPRIPRVKDSFSQPFSIYCCRVFDTEWWKKGKAIVYEDVDCFCTRGYETWVLSAIFFPFLFFNIVETWLKLVSMASVTRTRCIALRSEIVLNLGYSHVGEDRPKGIRFLRKSSLTIPRLYLNLVNSKLNILNNRRTNTNMEQDFCV